MRAMQVAGSSLLVLVTLACGGDSSPTTPAVANPFVIAYTAISDTDCRIVIATLDGRIDSLPQTTCGDDAAWSPDGHRIAFEKLQGEDANPSLWIVNADGTGAAAIPGGGELEFPEWSPDGTRLAAIVSTAGTIAVLKPDGTDRIDLPSSVAPGSRPSWSADGASILFATFDTLRLVTVATGAVRVLAAPSVHGVFDPRWSPGDSRISFVARTPGSLGVYVIDADGSNQQLLTETFVQSSVSWSADGRSLLYAAALGPGFANNVFVQASDGSGAPRSLTSNVLPRNSYGPDWARAR
jgi:Tol biopolymer transport system component